jgi:hypothetical protein
VKVCLRSNASPSESNRCVEREGGQQVGEERGPGGVVQEAGKQQSNQSNRGQCQTDANGGMEGGCGFIQPGIQSCDRDLFEAGHPEQCNLFAKTGVRRQFANRLLTRLRFGLRGGVEQEAGESTLANAGAYGCKHAEDGVQAQDIQIAIVEVRSGAKLVAGQAGLGLGTRSS